MDQGRLKVITIQVRARVILLENVGILKLCNLKSCFATTSITSRGCKSLIYIRVVVSSSLAEETLWAHIAMAACAEWVDIGGLGD